jgi:hypothetical protein
VGGPEEGEEEGAMAEGFADCLQLDLRHVDGENDRSQM